MAQVKTSNKKQIISIIIIVAMLSSSFFLIYRRFIQKPQELELSDQTTVIQDKPQGLSLTELSSQALLKEILQDLKKFGDWPVAVVILGRSNPFIPL